MNPQIDIDIREEDGKLVCKVKIPSYSRIYPYKTRLKTSDIRDHLHGNKKLYKSYILIKEGYVNNHSSPPILESEWVYQKPAKKTVKRKKPNTPSK